MTRNRLLPALAATAALSLAVSAAGAEPASASGPGQGRQNAWVGRTLRAMTLEEKVGQLFVPYVTGGTADTASQENLDRFGVATPAEAVQKLHLGGVIYFAWSGNTASPAQIATLSNGLQRAAMQSGRDRPGRNRDRAVPLTIATDQETGLVARVLAPATQFPGAMALGAGRDLRATRDTFAITGAELSAIGINTDYAPDADVNVNPANPIINTRSFGEDATRVGELAAAYVRGLRGRLAGGKPIHQVRSVASLFISRVDVAANKEIAAPGDEARR